MNVRQDAQAERTPESDMVVNRFPWRLGGDGHTQSKLNVLAAIVKSRVNMIQATDFTDKEAPGLEALDGTPLQDISNALDWALEEPFWLQRIAGAGALKSLLRNLPTIQRQMAAKKKASAKVNQTQLKAASVAASPDKAFTYEGEIL
jgi:hypothetical protein